MIVLMTFQVDSPGTVLIITLLDILALDILGLDILGLDILGLDILGRFPFRLACQIICIEPDYVFYCHRKLRCC